MYLAGNSPFVRTISEVWKMGFTWSMPKFSKQQLNILVVSCFFVSNITITDAYIQCTNVNSFKGFLVSRCCYLSNLLNFQKLVIEMTPYYIMWQKPNKNSQNMEIKDTFFCNERLINRSFLVLEIFSPWLHKPKNLMVNRVS